LEVYQKPTLKLWTDEDVASVPAIKAAFDDIRVTRKSDFANNFREQGLLRSRESTLPS
jgi:hypothetical protein